MRNYARRPHFLCLLVALAACALNGHASSASAPPRTDATEEDAIRENVRQMETGWNTKSGALYAKPFAADADHVVVNGTHLRGREAIGQSHQRIFDTFFKHSVLTVSIKQIRFLRPDVAVVHVTGNNRVGQGAETRELKVIVTVVMTKDKGEWKITAFQNTLIADEAHAAGRPR